MYTELDQAWAELTAPGMPFAIEKVAVRGVAVKCFVQMPPNLRELWLATTAFADREYLIYEDERLTYAQAHVQVAAIASWLCAQGVRPGDRVAIAMRNYPEWLLSYWAILSVGATVVGMNSWWVGPEMAYALQDSEPKVLICDADRLAIWWEIRRQVPDCTVVAVRSSNPLPAEAVVPYSQLLLAIGAPPNIDIDPDLDACIFYTSGTTGRPKGAQLTHRGCLTNVMNMAFAAEVGMRTAALRNLPVPDPEERPPPVTLLTTPLFHVTANNCAAHSTTAQGGKLLHMYKWDPAVAVRLIERERVTNMTGVPIMARELVEHPDFAVADTSSLVQVSGGGAQLQPDLVAAIDSAVATARPSTGYGMTEVCGIITSNSGDFFVDKPDSCGRVMPSFEYQCVDDEGKKVRQGAVGELWVRGAAVTKGYLNCPEATAQTITDGWLHTGDLARIDDQGFVYIVDRKKDMVLRGGENVYCAEVESALFAHPEILECAVFSVPDSRLGEEVGAALVVRPRAEPSADEIRTYCRSLLAAYKIPRYIWLLRDPLPRNANGKYLKQQLSKTLALADAL